MSAPHDLVSLSWCLGEIRQSFAQAEALLEKQLAAEPDDFTALRQAKVHIHQAGGALLVIDISGVSTLVREIEMVLDAVETNVVNLSGDLVSRINGATRAGIEYLEDLIQGEPHRPLLLFSYMKALLEARGAERIHPADLFDADLTRSLPQVVRDESAITRDQIAAAKLGFETGLLQYLREPGSPTGVECMFSAVTTLERSRLAGANRNFWRVVLAFFDALRTGALPPDVYSRRLLARLNLQLRQTIDKRAPIADRLFRDTLFSLAYAKAGSPIVAHVRKVYALDGMVPDDFETPRYGRHDVRVLRAARDALAKAKVSWDKVMRGSLGEMAAVGQAFEAFREAVDQLPGPGMKALAVALVETRRALAEFKDRLGDSKNESVTLELATAILFAEQVLEQGGRAGDTHDPQAAEMARRLSAAVNGQGSALGDVPAWLRVFSRAAQERLTMTTFVAETLGNLRSVEKHLDAYFRDTSKLADLPESIRSLNQVAGAMALLGHQDASRAAQVAAERVSYFAESASPPAASEFEQIASSLGALGFFVEGLLQPGRHTSSFEFDDATGEFRARLTDRSAAAGNTQADAVSAEPVNDGVRTDGFAGSAEQNTGAEPALALLSGTSSDDDSVLVIGPVESADTGETVSLESTSRANVERTENLLASLVVMPDDQAVRGQLKEALEQVRDDAMLHDDTVLEHKAEAALELLGSEAAGELQQLSERVADFAPAAPAVSIAPAPAPVPASESDVDSELLEIFLSEATEVLEAIGSNVQASRKAPGDQQFLTTIRRGFHTLKGSSRMVGLNSFGEAGWSMEQVMNAWLSDERPGTDELYDLVTNACTHFAAWVQALGVDSRSRIHPAAVVAAADNLRAGRAAVLEPYDSAPAGQPVVSSVLDDALQAAAVADTFNLQAYASDMAELPAAIVVTAPDTVALTQVDDVPGEQRPVDEFELRSLVPDMEPDLSVDVPDLNAQLDAAIADMVNQLPQPETQDVQASQQPLAAEQTTEDHQESAGTVATPAEAVQDDLGDYVSIDGRLLSRPLYMIFLGEADELVSRLVEDSKLWHAQNNRMIEEVVVRAAHSLKGSSALVGLAPVHEIARSLETIYLQLNWAPTALDTAALKTLTGAIDQLQQMLHQFAGGREPKADSAVLDALAALEASLQSEAAGLTSLEAVTPADSEPENPVVHAEVLDLVDEIDPDLLPIFVEEAEDYLPQIGEDLRLWAASPANLEPAQRLMRAMHTVKGSARMAGAMNLGQHVHEMETQIESLLIMQDVPLAMIESLTVDHDRTVALFEAVKDPSRASAVPARRVPGTLGVAPDRVDPELAAPLPEGLRSQDEAIPASAEFEPQISLAALPITALAPIDPSAAGSAISAMPGSNVAAASPGTDAARTATGAIPAEPAAKPAAGTAAPVQLVRVRADLLDRLVNDTGEVSIARSRLDNELTGLRQSLVDLTENVNRLRTQLREIEIQAESQIQARNALQREQDRSFDPLEFDRFTRFQELARMLAESVNDVATVQHNASRNLDVASQDLLRQGQVLRELQQNLMRVRMVPFGSISDRMYRVARQAAKDTGKRVNLDLRGSSAEIDRGVLEKMAGPIEHLLRNAVAHGIESREERLAAGKPETGEIRIEVRQEGNEIVLSFSDDGKGLDIERIKARAVKQGLVDPDEPLSAREAADLIFSPGFSTAEKVTELAGRGVGMDVVRAETNALGGRIDTESETGKGTRFMVHLPLTLAVAQVVIVSAGEHRFAVPSSSVENVMQLKPQALTDAYTSKSIDWQGQRVPIAYLGTLIDAQDLQPLAQHYSPVVIVRSGTQRVAMHVDSITRNQEVVVKNVGPQVARVHGVSGATVMGNGDIVLIINPVMMAQAVGNVLDNGERIFKPLAVELANLPATIMVVDDSVTVRKVTQRLLARERYDVQLAKDGVDALRQLQDTVPDVMLVDIEMPRMDGFDLTRHVRADERLKHIPIIMITSRTADKHRNYAKSLGVNAYLGKPYVDDELLALVRSLIGQEQPAALESVV